MDSKITVSDLREYISENNSHFTEDDSLGDIHQDWFNEALDTEFFSGEELADKWNVQKNEYATRSEFVADMFREHVSDEVIDLMPHEQRDLFVKIHVGILSDRLD